MPDLDAIKTETKRLLSEGVVEVVVAFKPGDTPLHPQPAFFMNVDDVDSLVYDGLCQNNLATFLTRLPKSQKIGMLVRGCENRSVNALVVEKQKLRENLFLVGIPCEGIIDWRKIVERAGEAVIDVHENGLNVFVDSRTGNFNFNRADLLHESCLRCTHRTPVNADILIGEALPEGDLTLAATAVEVFEAHEIDERYAWFQRSGTLHPMLRLSRSLPDVLLHRMFCRSHRTPLDGEWRNACWYARLAHSARFSSDRAMYRLWCLRTCLPDGYQDDLPDRKTKS